MVTGPDGEEIWTDKYGRVKVQFPWDRLGKNDENSSCWVRVSQAWAGGGFGGIHIPRIGQEVMVEFLQGDPDRPIITGRVYDGTNMPPYGLPASATQSGIKSNSTKGGGGSNELRFEDKKGQEQVYLHAQKNEDIVSRTTRPRPSARRSPPMPAATSNAAPAATSPAPRTRASRTRRRARSPRPPTTRCCCTATSRTSSPPTRVFT